MVERAYIDSGIVMRLVEGEPQAHKRLFDRVAELKRLVTSVVTRTECMVIARRTRSQPVIELYDVSFDAPDMELVNVDRAVADEACEVRATFGLKVPDAIHIATAVIATCPLILTSDSDLVRCQGHRGLTIELIPRVAINA